MFTPLHNNKNQELFEKHVCNHGYNQSSYYEKYNGAVYPSYRLKLKYLLPFTVSFVQLVTQQYKSRSVWKVLL